MNSKDYSVKMAFQKLSSQMEDHNSDLNSETLHKSGDSSNPISPYHHQTNGEAERFVRTVKDTLTKEHHSGQDPDIALLCYRSTPINSKLPLPAALMNSRRYRTLLPTRTMLKLREEEREELMSLK